MGDSLKPQHLNRYRQIAWIFMKYGRSDLVQSTGLSEALEAEQRVAPAEAAKANELAGDLEKLGPTFVKLGQLLSTRVELLPAAYLEALARLQDRVEPFSFTEAEKIVSEEIGVRISKAFAEFESEPMAAASLGQVHRATLRACDDERGERDCPKSDEGVSGGRFAFRSLDRSERGFREATSALPLPWESPG